jgi:hypothetical protein
MTLSIRDAAADRSVRTLANRKEVGLTESARLAVANELRRLDDETPLRERIAAIRRSLCMCIVGSARLTTLSSRTTHRRPGLSLPGREL